MIQWDIMSTSRQAEQENLWRWLLALLQELTTPAGRRRARARVRSAVKRAGLPRVRLAITSRARMADPLSWRPHDLAERLARRTRRQGPSGRQGSPSGGLTVRERYGEQFYSSIGARGGSTVLEERGVEYLQDIGARGGAATRQRYGREHYAEIGRKGGLAGRGAKRPRKRPKEQLDLGL